MRRVPRAGYLLVAILVCVFGPRAARAQLFSRSPVDLRDSVYLNEDTVAKSHLLRAEAYLNDGQWAEAIDILQQVMESSGDKLIELVPNRFSNVRTYCHHVIARLPADALAEYRARVDVQAESWYREGLAHRDVGPLRRVVEYAFASRWGDDALDLLAELSLEQGEYALARASWERILPLPAPPQGDEGPGDLAYPDSDLPQAEIRAKLVLASVLAGNLARARSDFERFAELHPDAEGVLAGQRGRLRDRLADVIEQSSGWPPSEVESSWPTFAGNPARTKRLPRAVDVGAVQWKKPLKPQHETTLSRSNPIPFRGRAATARKVSLSYHPLLVDNVVLVNNDETVSAYEVETGDPAWPGAADSDNPVIFELQPADRQVPPSASGRNQAIGTPHYTMTAADGRLFVRMGLPHVSAAIRRRNFNTSPQPGSLICLDLMAQGKLLWEKQNEDDWAFEGSPIADRENAYVAVRRNSGFMPEAHVVCYDARTGTKKWDRLICQGTSPTGGAIGELSHNLLSLADGVLYYCTNLGAIAALDARDGQIRWIVTYPRSASNRLQGNAKHFQRELNPCVVTDGTVLVAPSDTPLVLALDADTGHVHWQTDLLADAVHLLGVGQGNLIATGDQVWAVNTETGKIVWRWPDTSRETKEHGRGVLVGSEVYWPVQDEILVLRQSDGALVRRIPLEEQHGETGGNLLVASGYLLVAQADGLVAFSQYSRLFDHYKDQIAERPDDAAAHLDFARAAEAIERWDLAEESFRRARDLARSDDRMEERPLRQFAADRLFHLQLKRAESFAEQQQWDETIKHYQDAAGDALEPSQRLTALLRTAETWVSAGNPTAAIGAYQQVLAEDRLRRLTVVVSDKLRRRCDLEVGQRIAGLIARHGRAVYASIDERAAEELTALFPKGDATAIEEAVARYPNAEMVPEAMLHLARLHQEQGRAESAAQVYNQLRRDPDHGLNRAELLFGLARCYEQMGFWQRARATWEELRTRYPHADLSSFQVSLLADRLVEQVLLDPPYLSLPGRGEGPSVELPLVRRWDKRLADAEVFIPQGERPDLSPANVFIVGERIECLAAEDASVRWTLPTAGRTVWLGYSGEHLVVATDRSVTAVYASTGERAWHWSAEVGPVSDGPPVPVHGENEAAALSDFAVAGSRIIFAEGGSRLRALDAQTGGVAWSFEPTQGTLGPRFQCNQELVVLQTLSPGRLVTLDTLSGRVRYERELGDAPWPRVPLLADASQLYVVSDRVHVQRFDARRGDLLWETSGPSSPANGPPDVLGDAAHLLVVLNGYILERVDPDTGKVLWQKGLGTEPLANPRDLTAVDATNVYCVSRGELKAFRLSDGKLVWSQRVGAQGAWRVERLFDYVVCYPASQVDRSIAGQAALSAPVSFFRPEDGRPVQQLNFFGAGGQFNVQFLPQATVVADRETVWALDALERHP